ncbi:rCG41825, isoform CRA_a [Rattus norvegicus]|uniref:RCG41825, isoform CRA_a n=1 Tax=Rattus norvegicus TaxID=10116 RepID=A6KT54_RAT|nr:rCG41825, isoform CRA_a [Rattus norvegicus]EDL86709.1 rCG41825, isoform CRA_a [Rattus norvegicus]
MTPWLNFWRAGMRPGAGVLFPTLLHPSSLCPHLLPSTR